MKKYYIGLLVLGVLTFVLTIYTISLGVIGKQDVKTLKSAQSIADKLDKYLATAQKIPVSLDVAGITGVPKTITYTKKSEETYEFCVTYKTASDAYSSTNISSVLLGTLYGGSTATTSGYDTAQDPSAYTPSTLYISGSHKKGKVCQTIKPYLSSSYLNNYNYNYTPTPPPSVSLFDIQTKARNTERQTDIKAIHGQVEAYYAQSGKYPTLSNMNDSSWRSTNMKGLDTEALRDPQGSGKVLLADPSANAYSYAVFGSDGSTSCDNVKVDCAVYTLSATYEGGGTFTKTNLN